MLIVEYTGIQNIYYEILQGLLQDTYVCRQDGLGKPVRIRDGTSCIPVHGSIDRPREFGIRPSIGDGYLIVSIYTTTFG